MTHRQNESAIYIRTDFSDKSIFFLKDNWKTPDTYSEFYEPTKNSGVYAMIKIDFTFNPTKMIYTILYIGSAKNIQKRHSGHEVLKCLNIFYGHIKFYFIEVENYREYEKELIQKFKPIFNKTWTNG